MMNIEINKKVNTVSAASTAQTPSKSKENDGKFAKELKTLKEEKSTQETKQTTEAANAKDEKNKTQAASDEKDSGKIKQEDDEIKITDEDLKVGEVQDTDEEISEVVTEDIVMSQQEIKEGKNQKPKQKDLDINVSEKDIIEQEIQTVVPEQIKTEHITKQDKDNAKIDTKPEAQVSITKPDFDAETGEVIMKSEKSAKNEKYQTPEKELKPDKENEDKFKNIIANKTKESTSEQEVGESEKKYDDTIDESLVETTKVISGLENAVKEITELNRTNEKPDLKMQKEQVFADKKEEKTEDKTLIDNNMNVQDISEKNLPQMNTNMNFNAEQQPFSDFVTPKKEELKSNQKDLAEEQAILSTMAENVAIANQNMLNIKPEENAVQETNKKAQVKPTKPVETILQTVLQDEPEEVQDVQSKTKTVTTDEGVKKVDRKTNVVVETVVKYDSVIMDKSDVEFFSKLVDEGTVEMASVKHSEKSSQVSKTLADLLAKAMQDNKPIRIDFDNNISVIIKIGKDGKISADFLPSSQVAEAYLKENLPLLKQKLDDNNIEYDELNQRKQKQDNQENRKKGRKDE